MGNFIVFNPNVHRSTFVDLSEEYFDWMASELQKNYNIDVYSMVGRTLREYVENNVDEFASSIYRLLRQERFYERRTTTPRKIVTPAALVTS